MGSPAERGGRRVSEEQKVHTSVFCEAASVLARERGPAGAAGRADRAAAARGREQTGGGSGARRLRRRVVLIRARPAIEGTRRIVELETRE